MPHIKPISPDVVSLMAAGAVVDSMAAAVRELIDNAIDAQATQITIELWFDQWQIRITDNGQGILGDDLAAAATPHTTSKLAYTQPFHITTLGFRGEALHSLAQMSQLQIQSYALPDPHGWIATYDERGQIQTRDPAALRQGTIVTIRNLFYNWSSRRSALRSKVKKLRDVVDVVQCAALAHPQITWKLIVDRKPHLTYWSSDSALNLVVQMLPTVDLSDLRYHQHQGIEIILGLPDRCHRSRPDWIRVAVNHRFVHQPDLIQTIQKAFYQRLPRHRYPLCIAHLHLQPEAVDWNRHPAKLELYLQESEHYQEILQDLIDTTLATAVGTPTSRTISLIKASEKKQVYQTQPAVRSDSKATTPLKALAQLQNTYILAEHSAGLWLVEQHVAHERIRYEQLCQQWAMVDLPEPILLKDLTPLQVQHLQAIALDPEPFGPHVWLIRRLPLVLWSDTDTDADRYAALIELSYCQDLEAAKVSAACQTALRNGTPLNQDQMQRLLNAWQTTTNPHTCPHGRPIYLALAEKDLARFFRRQWTICDRDPDQDFNTQAVEQKLGDLVAGEIRRSSTDAQSNGIL